MTDTENDLSLFAADAETALTRAWNGPVRLGEAEVLRERGRNRVLRCPVTDGPDGSAATVIIKASVNDGAQAFDPVEDQSGGTASRFYNEAAGTALLQSLGGGAAPRCAAVCSAPSDRPDRHRRPRRGRMPGGPDAGPRPGASGGGLVRLCPFPGPSSCGDRRA